MATQYRLSGGKAFTADDMLIYNIEACVTTKRLTIQDIEGYFKKFGQVAYMRLIEADGNQSPEKIKKCVRYEILYKEARSAAKALKASRERQWYKNQAIVVKPYYTQQQLCTNVSINILNDDCLEYIFKFLPHKYQLNFASACRRFSAVLAELSTRLYRDFNFNTLKGMTSFEMRGFLEIVGPQIKILKEEDDFVGKWFGWENGLDSFLGTVLSNVEKFKVSCNSSTKIWKIVEGMHSLQEMQIDCSMFGDELIKTLQKLKNLRKLYINSELNNNVTAAEISKLIGLEEFGLFGFFKIVPQIKDIFKHLQNLTYLGLHGWGDMRLDTKDYELIAKYLLKLETLKISCKIGNYNCLAHLPKLARLEVKCIHGEQFLSYLSNHQISPLTELSIQTMQFTIKSATSVAQLKRLKVLRCHFFPHEKVIEELAKTKELEDISFYVTSTYAPDFHITVNGMLKLLKNALKLKSIYFQDSRINKRYLVRKVGALLEKQREQGYRNNCVHFAFMNIPRGMDPIVRYNSNTLKVTEVCEKSSHFYEIR